MVSAGLWSVAVGCTRSVDHDDPPAAVVEPEGAVCEEALHEARGDRVEKWEPCARGGEGTSAPWLPFEERRRRGGSQLCGLQEWRVQAKVDHKLPRMLASHMTHSNDLSTDEVAHEPHNVAYALSALNNQHQHAQTTSELHSLVMT